MPRLCRSRPHLSRHMTGWSRFASAGLSLLLLCLAQNGIAAQPYADLRLYKSAGQPVANGDGTYTVTFELTVRNAGSGDVLALQIEDNLNIFGDGRLISLGVTDVISGSLTPNAAYDGAQDIRLLAGHDRLKHGEEASLRFAVTFTPGAARRVFTNDAAASGVDGQSGEHVSASSWCTFEIAPVPSIALNKALIGDVLDNGDGSRSVSFRVTVSNDGNETLADIQISDLLDIFGSGQLLAVENLASTDLAVNTLYNGITDDRLLTGTDTLAVGEIGVVSLDLRFDPAAEPGPFVNRAVTTAVGVHSHGPVTASAEVSFPAGPPPPPPPPAISLTKELIGDVVDNGDGSRSASFRLNVINDGAETLAGVQLEDPLDIFGSGRLVAVENLAGDNLTPGPSFDGEGNGRILTGTDTLAAGDSGSVTFTLRFEPGNEPGPFINRAVATAIGETSNTTVSAESEVSFPVGPPPPPPPIAIFLGKDLVGEVVDNGDGSRSASFSLAVSNTGAESLVNVQLEDPLDFFGAGQLLGINNLASTRLAINPLFNGTTDSRLLTGADTLAADESGSVTFTLRFDPGSESGPFTNRAVATGVGEISTTPVSDDAVASFPAGPPPPPPPPIAIELDKELVGDVLTNADGSRSASFRLVVINVGVEALTDIQLEDSLNIFGSGELLSVDDLQSDSLQVNPSFDGTTNALLLTGADTLIANEIGVVTITLRFDPGTEAGPFTNRALATGRGENSNTVVDDDAEASFPVGPPPPPPPPIAIALDKALVGDVITNADGSRSASFRLTVGNIGTETLTGVQLGDPLDIFGAGQLLAIDDLSSSDLSVNPAFNGTTDAQLLTGVDSLAADESGVIILTLRFDPGAEPGPFTNRAEATGRGEFSNTIVTDDASVDFPAAPPPPPPPPIAIALDKALVGDVITSADGSRSASFSLTVTNIGTETLAGVQIDDPLNIFGAGQLLSVSEPSGSNLTVNPSFNGTTDSRLLAGVDELASNESGIVTFTLRFDPGTEPGPFTNRALATGRGEISNTVVNDDAEASFPVGPPPPPPPPIAVQLDKELVGDVTTDAEGVSSAVFRLTVRNAGTETLADVQIDDPLDIFGAGQLLSVSEPSSNNLTVNPLFNGTTDSSLLAGVDTLAADESGVVLFTIRFDPGTETGPFTNRAVATGRGETSNTVVNDDAEASFPVGPPPPPPPPPIAIELDKELVGDVTTNADGSRTASFSLTVRNTGTETLADVQIDDPLDIFGAGQLLPVSEPSSSSLTVNPLFNGTTDSSLLAGMDTLTSNESGIVTFTLRFDPGTEPGPFTNRAVATGRGETSNTVVNDDAEASFPVGLPPPPPSVAIGLTKEVISSVVVNDDGSQSVSLRLTVSNAGTETLLGVQLVDPLAIFRTGSLLDVEIIEAANLTLNENPAFDGKAATELLSGNDTLASNDTGFVTFALRFNAADEREPFINRAVATGTGEISGTPVTAEAEVKFAPLLVEPPVTGTKTVDRKTVVRGGLLGYDITITNSGDTDLEDVAVVDNPPEGFRFLTDSAVLIRPGLDDIFDTGDDLSAPIDSTGIDPVTFALFDLPGRDRARIRYVSRVGTGVAAGEHFNDVMISVCCGPP